MKTAIIKSSAGAERASDAVFGVALLPDCEGCYKGHFPGNPVSPGVCNIETIERVRHVTYG